MSDGDLGRALQPSVESLAQYWLTVEVAQAEAEVVDAIQSEATNRTAPLETVGAYEAADEVWAELLAPLVETERWGMVALVWSAVVNARNESDQVEDEDRTAEFVARAAEAFELSGDVLRADSIWFQLGEYEEAALALERAGDLRRASVRWVWAGEWDRAAELRERLGEYEEAAKIREAQRDADDGDLGEPMTIEWYVKLLQNSRIPDDPQVAVGRRMGELAEQSRWDLIAPLLEGLGCPQSLVIETYLKGEQTAEAMRYVERMVTAEEEEGGVEAAINGLSESLLTTAYGEFESGGEFVRLLSTYFGNYLEAHGRWIRAANLWDIGGECLRAANAFEQAGDLRRAASRYEESGRFLRAADLWDRAGDAQRANGARDLAALDEIAPG